MSIKSSGQLYRILSFDRAVQIFEREEIHFAHPSSWSDPYENRLTHSNSYKIFGQCWCTKSVSDAMWRIYSPNHLGVRIATSKHKLAQVLKREADKLGFELSLNEVQYLSQREIDARMKKIRNNLTTKFEVMSALDALFLKRNAFEHESEFRALIYSPNGNMVQAKKGIKIKINPHHLIESILLDPRAPDELVAALKYYFKEKIGFTGSVRRSVLYKSPIPLVVEDAE